MNKEYWEWLENEEVWLMEMWDIFEYNAGEYIHVDDVKWETNKRNNMNLFFSVLYLTR